MIVDLSARVVKEKRVELLHISGSIQLGESANFLAEIIKARDGVNLILDMTRIDYIDSSGIGELIALCADFREKGVELVLLNPPPRVASLILTAHLTKTLKIFADERKALASFAQ